MRANWNEVLAERLHRVDPDVGLLVEAVAVAAADVRERADQWEEHDTAPDPDIEILETGGVQLAGATNEDVAQLVEDGDQGLPEPLEDEDPPVGAVVIEWRGEAVNRRINSVTLRLNPRLDGGQPKEVTRWALDISRVDRFDGTAVNIQLMPRAERVYMDAPGSTAGDVVFALPNPATVGEPPAEEDQSATRINPGLEENTTEGRGTGRVLWHWPLTVITLRALKDDGTAAGNVGWAVDSSTNLVDEIGYTLEHRKLLPLTGEQAGWYQWLLDPGMPYLRISGSIFAEASVGFTGAGNQIDLGAVPAVDVELVAQGETPIGTSISPEVQDDTAAWIPFRDGDLVAVDNTPFGGTDLRTVSVQQQYQLRATLTPDGNGLSTPILRALGARALTRQVFDQEVIVSAQGSCGFDPATSEGEIQEVRVTIARTGERDYRDPGTELISQYDVADLELRLWMGATNLSRHLWLHLHSFLVDDVIPSAEAITLVGLTPLTLTRAAIPHYDQALGKRTVAEYTNATVPNVYADLLDSEIALPERYRGPGIPESVASTVSKRIEKADGKEELDAIAYVAAGAVISSQGRVRFVTADSSRDVVAVFPMEEIREAEVGPGYRQRRPEFFVPFGYDDVDDRYVGEVRSFHIGSLESVGSVALDAPPVLDDRVARWIDTQALAELVADRVTRFTGLGLMVWSWTSEYAHPHIEPGDVVLVQTDSFVARDPNLGRVLRGVVWARAVITAVHDLEGREFTGWVQRYADIFPVAELGDLPLQRELWMHARVSEALSTSTHWAIEIETGADIDEVWGAAGVFAAEVLTDVIEAALSVAAVPVASPLMVPRARQGQVSGYYLQPVSYRSNGTRRQLSPLVATVHPTPEEPPVFTVRVAEEGDIGTALISWQERGVAVTDLRVRTKVGDEPPAAWRAPYRDTGHPSVITGALLGARAVEHDVILHETRFSHIEAEYDADSGEVGISIPVPPFDRNPNPTIVSLDIIGRKAKCGGDGDVKSWLAHRNDVPSTDPDYWEQEKDGSYVTFDVPGSTRWSVEFVARNDLIGAVDGATLSVSETRMVGDLGTSDPRISFIELEPPPSGSTIATVRLQMVDLPDPPTGWSLLIEARKNLGSGWGPTWSDITAVLDPAPAASNLLTEHDWSTTPQASDTGALVAQWELRVTLLDGTDIKDSNATQRGWAYGTGGREIL